MTMPPRDGWPARYEVVAEARGHESWAAWVAEIEARLGRTICGRMRGKKSKEPGAPCEKAEGSGCRRMKGPVGACKEHNGDTPAGEASPGYKDGRRSRAPSIVNRTLRERMDQQPDMLRMMNQAGALLMARLEDLVDRVDARAMGPGALAGARVVMRDMGQAGSPDAMAKLLGQLRGIIEGEAGVDDTWRDELYQVIDLVGQHSDRMRRLLIDAREMVPRDRVLQLIDRFGTEVVDVVETLPLTAEQKREVRRELAGVVARTMNGRALPTVTSTGTDG